MVLIKADTKLKLGAPSRIRTYDLQIRSLSLYPTELWAHNNGAEDEIRTRDIRHGKATLYH